MLYSARGGSSRSSEFRSLKGLASRSLKSYCAPTHVVDDRPEFRTHTRSCSPLPGFAPPAPPHLSPLSPFPQVREEPRDYDTLHDLVKALSAAVSEGAATAAGAEARRTDWSAEVGRHAVAPLPSETERRNVVAGGSRETKCCRWERMGGEGSGERRDERSGGEKKGKKGGTGELMKERANRQELADGRRVEEGRGDRRGVAWKWREFERSFSSGDKMQAAFIAHLFFRGLIFFCGKKRSLASPLSLK